MWEDVRISLGSDAEASGRLSFVSPTRIEGKLKGEVRGEVLGASRIEVCAGGRLFGDVETQSFVVHEGATFEGRSRMGGQATAASGTS